MREVAARSLRFSPAIGSEPFIAAARVERDPAARTMLLSCLTYRRRDRANVLAIVAFLADTAVYTRRMARDALRAVDDATVGAAIAPCVARAPDHGEAGALAGLEAWLAAPSQSTRATLVAILEAGNGPHPPRIDHVWECLRAAVSGDLPYALRTGQRVAAEAARRDPASRQFGAVRGPVIAARRAYHLAGLAQLYAARLIRAGVDPLPPGPLCRLLVDGEDPVEALREAAAVPDITHGDVLVVHASGGRTVRLGYER